MIEYRQWKTSDVRPDHGCEGGEAGEERDQVQYCKSGESHQVAHTINCSERRSSTARNEKDIPFAYIRRVYVKAVENLLALLVLRQRFDVNDIGSDQMGYSALFES
jgi:hypothetical protein